MISRADTEEVFLNFGKTRVPGCDGLASCGCARRSQRYQLGDKWDIGAQPHHRAEITPEKDLRAALVFDGASPVFLEPSGIFFISLSDLCWGSLFIQLLTSFRSGLSRRTVFSPTQPILSTRGNMTTMMEPAKPPPPHISPPGMYYTKLVLRTLQFAIAIANVGLVGSLLSTGFWGFATLVVITPQVPSPPLLAPPSPGVFQDGKRTSLTGANSR